MKELSAKFHQLEMETKNAKGLYGTSTRGTLIYFVTVSSLITFSLQLNDNYFAEIILAISS